MGQSVLRDGRAPFRRDGRWPPLPSADRKGVGFRSPNPEWRRWAPRGVQCGNATDPGEAGGRSEEHTSELQSLTNLVCRLLLEKKNKHGRMNGGDSDSTAEPSRTQRGRGVR